MEYRTLDINVISAKDLKKVNLISKTRAYVVVSISSEQGRSSIVYRTAVDRRGNANPSWNFPAKFTVDESAAQSNRLVATFRIRCRRFLGDKDIGEVKVEIIGPVEDGNLQFVTHKVGNKSGKLQGELNFSYKWGKKIVCASATTPMATKVNKDQEPVTAFPARVGSSSANPPPPTRNAYQSQQSSTGLQMNYAGLALSGLLIADIISNTSHDCGGGCGGGGSGVSGGGGCGGGGCGGGGGGGGGGGCGGGGGGCGGGGN